MNKLIIAVLALFFMQAAVADDEHNICNDFKFSVSNTLPYDVRINYNVSAGAKIAPGEDTISPGQTKFIAMAKSSSIVIPVISGVSFITYKISKVNVSSPEKPFLGSGKISKFSADTHEFDEEKYVNEGGDFNLENGKTSIIQVREKSKTLGKCGWNSPEQRKAGQYTLELYQ